MKNKQAVSQSKGVKTPTISYITVHEPAKSGNGSSRIIKGVLHYTPDPEAGAMLVKGAETLGKPYQEVAGYLVMACIKMSYKELSDHSSRAARMAEIAKELASAGALNAVPEEPKADLLEEMIKVGATMDEGRGENYGIGLNYGIGFVKGKLVYCDSKTYQPIELRDSIRVFKSVLKTGCWTGEYPAQARWLNMIAKAI